MSKNDYKEDDINFYKITMNSSTKVGMIFADMQRLKIVSFTESPCDTKDMFFREKKNADRGRIIEM